MSFAKRLRRFTLLIFCISLVTAQSRDEVIKLIHPVTGSMVDTNFVDVEVAVADFFTVGNPGCSDCDGYIQITMDGTAVGQMTSDAAVTVFGLSEGSHFIEIEALDPFGASFSTVVYDSATFTVDMVSVPNICPARNLDVVAGDARNFLQWTPPLGGMSGDLGCGDYVVTALPFNATGTNLGMGDDWVTNAVNQGEDVAYTLNLHEEMTLSFDLCSSVTDYDTYLQIFSGCPPSEITVAFDDDGPTCSESSELYAPSLIEDLVLPAGQYYVVIDGFNGGTGNFELNIFEGTRSNPSAYNIKESAMDDAAKMITMGVSEEEVEAMLIAFRERMSRTNNREIDPACGTFVNYAVVNPTTGTIIAMVDTTFYIHEGLTNNTEYCYEIVANYNEGNSQPTDAVCATPEQYFPDPPTNLAAQGWDEAAFLNWTSPDVPQLGIPYSEDFSSQLVDLWTWEGDNWSIYATIGNPSPSAQFSWTPAQDNYDYSLYSPFIPLDGATDVIVTFDMYLNNFSVTGEEFLTVEYLSGGSWNFIREFVNTNDIPWDTYIDTLSGLSGSIRLRFRAHGTDSFNLNYWYIDNVMIDDYTSTRDMTGSTVSTFDTYIPGNTHTMEFSLNIQAPDIAYSDSVAITFPTGVTILDAGPDELGFGGEPYGPEPYNGIDGQTISWGTNANDGAGGIFGSLTAWATLHFDSSLTGPISGSFHVSDDWYNTPVDVDGNFNINQRNLTDGDLLGYNVYVDGSTTPHNSMLVEETSYVADGLTNGQSYTLGVTAVYYPDYESSQLEATATPTWLYGDISGTITDPNGNLLDSAIVRTGTLVDTTGSDGVFLLENLEPGEYTVTVMRSDFEGDAENVTVLAQAAAVSQDFVLIPSLARPGGLIASAGDQEVDLIWNTPGAIPTGDWMFFHDGEFENAFSAIDGGMGLAQLFVPLSYPATIKAVRFHVSDFGSPTQDAEVTVFADDGFTVLSGPYIVPGVANNWIEIDIDDATIGSGGFLVATYNVLPGGPYVSVDDSYYDGSLFFGNVASGWTEMGTLGYQYVGSHEALIASAGRTMTMAGDISNSAKSILRSEQPSDVLTVAGYHGESALRLPNILRTTTTTNDSLIGYNVYQALDDGDTLVYTASGPNDTTATIAVPANYVEYCYNVKARWDTDDYGVLESKQSNIACATPYLPGDIDFNDDVDISDLLTCVDFILEVDIPTESEFRNADVNMDMEINIADVVMIVDIIYGTAARMMASTDSPVLVDLLSSNQQLQIKLDYEGLTRGLQFTLLADALVEIGTPLLSVSDGGTLVASNRAEDGTVTIVVVNTAGGSVDRVEDVLVSIPYTFKGDRRDKSVVELTDFKAAGMAGESLPVTIREKRIDISVVPSVFALHQNYPNPFNPVTEIQFDVPQESQVQLTIYNIMGQEVTTLNNSTLQAGFHSIRWDGTNGLGEQVSTGVYFYRLSSPAFTSTKKMIMVK